MVDVVLVTVLTCSQLGQILNIEDLHDKYYDGLHFKFDTEEKEKDSVEDENGEKFYPLEIHNKGTILKLAQDYDKI